MPGGVEDSTEIRVEEDVVLLVVRVLDTPQQADRCIVHDDVEPSELADRFLDGAFHGVAFPDVAASDDDPGRVGHLPVDE